MLYYYNGKTVSPDLGQLESDIASSAMSDKSIVWSRWDEDESKITLDFENELSPTDKAILDGLVEGV